MTAGKDALINASQKASMRPKRKKVVIVPEARYEITLIWTVDMIEDGANFKTWREWNVLETQKKPK